jgi:argininosuccinate lyase
VERVAALLEARERLFAAGGWLIAAAMLLAQLGSVHDRGRPATERGVELAGLDLATLRAAHPAFEADVASWLDPARAVDRRDVIGGPARQRVLAEIARIESELG